MNSYLPIAIFLIVGLVFVVFTLGFSWLVRPKLRETGEKLATYECGEIPVGEAWTQFRIGYYIYLLIFVIFDVEVLFLFPWAMSMKGFKHQAAAYPSMVWIGLADMVIFVAILAVGLAYAWKKGVLKWE
jgi:NADH-quinone oxidoreductase subunit A